MIGIVDYGVGNIQSVKNALNYIGAKTVVVKDPHFISKCDKIILPGVGAYADAMNKLRSKNLDEAVCEFANSGRYILGICLGLQLLFEQSDEFGQTKGLGLISGRVVGFDSIKFGLNLKIPHVGWNCAFKVKKSPIFKNLDEIFYLYFVHSYHVVCDEKYILAKTKYGYEFASIINKDNIFGIQPHPEKSHKNGIEILKNFVEL